MTDDTIKRASHTAWQATVAAGIVAALHGAGIETGIPDEAEIAAAVGVIATLFSAAKTHLAGRRK